MIDENLAEEIRELVSSGNKIAAVKRYREETGAGLAEAKTAVETLAKGGTLPERGELDDSDLNAEVIRLLGQGEKIQAVKLVRERTGVGLKEAKVKAEQIGADSGLPAESGTGCFGMILLAIGISAAAAATAADLHIF